MKRALVLAVDYGQKWPLNDIMSSDPRPDWDSIISSDLRARLIAWARFFNDHMDWETGLFGSEERRAWFDREGVSLLSALQDQAGSELTFELRL
ncbi:hypothetical protein [Galbitalea soli]|uniref:Uncharacterized protein n=1 Tax=Galbitalea soli TaxID=1268042 RepID=A0A7C9PPE7_9MICO|nr:hypothetical protein [Galbitalea soli]NEM92313.1 hypothetical protein [Galbitalea soli]NYJ31731.1 hypothetical protein [Galbitalea soli]